MNVVRTLKRWGVVLWMLGAGAGAPVLAGPVSKEQLLAAWEANWSAVRDLEVRYELIQWTEFRGVRGGCPGVEGAAPERAPYEPVGVLEAVVRWTEGRYFVCEQEPAREAISRSFDFTTREYRELFHYEGKGTGRVRRVPVGARWYTWVDHLLRWPGAIAHGHAGADLTGNDLGAMLRSPTSVTRAQTEVVEGAECTLVDVYDDARPVTTVWCDPRRGVPMRYVRWGPPDATVELHEYVQVGGAWFPLLIDTYHERQSVSQQFRVLTDAEGRPHIRVNVGFPPEAFAVQFPKGAVVTDEDSGKALVSTGSALAPMGNGLVILAERLHAAAAELRGQPARREVSQSGLVGTQILAWALVGAVGCALRLVRR